MRARIVGGFYLHIFDVNEQLNLRMREEIGTQEIPQLFFVVTKIVAILIGDRFHHVGSIARFSRGFRGMDDRTNLLLIAAARACGS